MNTIINKNCIEGIKDIPDNTIDIIIADPPYNIGKDFGNNTSKMTISDYLEWCDKWIIQCIRVLKPHGTLYIYGFSENLAFIRTKIKINVRWIIWHYTNKTTPTLKFWQRSHESILACSKQKPIFNRDDVREPYTNTFLKNAAGKKRKATKGRFSNGEKETIYKAHSWGALPRDVIKIPAGGAGKKERVDHPTQKPLALCEKLIKASQNKDIKNNILLVPFAGSGSECVAAKKLGVNFIAFEINLTYIELCNKRLNIVNNMIIPPLNLQPYYDQNKIKIYNNDCVEGIKYLIEQKSKVHLTVTSPPYFNVKDYVKYENYQKYLLLLEDLFTLIYKITHEGRMCCVNLSNILITRESRNSESRRIPLPFHFVNIMEKIGWNFLEDILWIKPEGAAKNRNGGFYQHRQPVAYKPNVVNEYIFIFKKPSGSLIDKVVRSYSAIDSVNSKVENGYERSNVWRINPETRSKHPAPYPCDLVDKVIQYYSYVGDTILDPFMGSGTTAVSSYKLNRKCIGFEIHTKYIDLLQKRIDKTKPKTLISKITLNKEDYKDLDEENCKKKLNKFSKKYLLELVNDKSLSKANLINMIYNDLT